MKTSILQFIFPALIVLTLNSCKKQDVDFTAEYKSQTDEQLMISAEIDAATIDANTAVESANYFFEKRSNVAGICDGTVIIDSSAAYKYITISYDGVNCSGKTKRSGQILINMQKNMKWCDVNAVLHLTYKNLSVTRISDNKTVVINGDVDLTNAMGGRMSEVGTREIVHLIHSNGMNITFDDGTTRSWQLAVKRVYSYDNGLVITSTGNHSEGTKTGISAWGMTRAGRNFTSMIAEPMIIRQDCGFRMVSAKLIQEQTETLMIQFGLNERGEKVTCPAGNYFLEVSWNNAKNKGCSIIVPY